MSKNLTISLILLIIIPIIIFLFYKKNPPQFDSVNLKIKGIDYKLEVAKSISQKSTGLSKRTKLCSNCGMIFIFNQDGSLPFWMKDTLIPLDMIWINSKGEVVDIKNVRKINSLDIIQNSTPAKYVIELNIGDTQKINLKIGDTINLSSLSDQ